MGHAPKWNANIEMTPVDFLADLITDISLKLKAPSATIYNLDNPNDMGWTDYISLVNRIGGYNIALIDPEKWRHEFLFKIDKDNKFSPLAFLYSIDHEEIHYWKLTHDHALQACKELNKEYPKNYDGLLKVYLGYLKEIGFIPK